MIYELKQNINTEIDILREISNYLRKMSYAAPSEQKILTNTIDSLRTSARMINNSIPAMLDDITIAQKLTPKQEANKNLQKIEFHRLDSRIHVVLKVEDRERFLKELSVGEDLIRKLKKKDRERKGEAEDIRSARLYLKIANRFFLKNALDLINRGYFKSLAMNLRKANVEILLSSYVALIIFSTIATFLASIFVFIFFMFFQFDFSAGYIPLSAYSGSYLLRFAYVFWIPIVLPLIGFLIIYFYPSSERDSLAKRIEQELPFAVIHMSAISSSGIEPSQIFKIIGVSTEYPTLRKEIRKVLNQINLYGYDLVTALGNVSKSTPSPKLAELFSGLAVTITSGGELSNYFEKRAESLLIGYRLDREKYTKTAETFMDIYISIVIAAPMILMVLMIMMEFSGMAGGAFAGSGKSGIIALIVGVINIIFLAILQIRQPGY